jgi:3alpha(or 20beta)-hydroxysteroid dehydrogenase
MGRLDGKVALVTGAARGQGAEEARLFAAEGARVMLGDVLDDDGEVVAKEIGKLAAYRHHDVTNESDWEAIVAATRSQFGRVDVLVNNAGVFRIIGMTATTLDEYMRIVAVNQVGTFLGMKAVAATMIGQGSGSIVNISREQVRRTGDDEGRRVGVGTLRRAGQLGPSGSDRHDHVA